MPEKKDALLYKVAQRIFEAATSESLGATFHVIISFHLEKKFGKDPYEVFVDNPTLFYNGLKEVLGEGAEAIITLVSTFIKIKYAVAFATEDITRLFRLNDPDSPEKMRELLHAIIVQEEKKLKNDTARTR
jgi:hypothetical protein